MIIPTGHRVLVRPEKLEDIEANKTKQLAEQAGLVLPDKVREDLESEADREQASVDRGYVISLGSTAYDDFGGHPWVKPGDYIAYARHAGKLIKDPETQEELLVLNDEDVVCKFTIDKEAQNG